jgi:hypothetical protein
LRYKNLDLISDSRKGYADVATNIDALGGEMNSSKAQQKLALLNHQVIFAGLKKVHGLNTTLDRRVDTICTQIKKGLIEKKVSVLKILLLNLLFFTVVFFISIYIMPELFTRGYFIVSIGLACATSVLTLMLLKEREKYTFNKILMFLEEENIEIYFELHKELAQVIDESDDEEEQEVENRLKETIAKYIN